MVSYQALIQHALLIKGLAKIALQLFIVGKTPRGVDGGIVGNGGGGNVFRHDMIDDGVWSGCLNRRLRRVLSLKISRTFLYGLRFLIFYWSVFIIFPLDCATLVHTYRLVVSTRYH